MLCPTNLSKAVEDGQAQPSSTRSLGGISSSLPALSVVSQRSEWCSVPPTCQSSWRLSRLVPQRSDWNHLSHADRWSWLRPKYLGQWYTIVQTFWPFGYDIFKIPKCQNQLYFWFKIARVACLVSCITWWYMIPNARRKFEAFLKFPEGFGHWGRSILVNGILYFRLFGHLDMTSSKYQNVKINLESSITCW